MSPRESIETPATSTSGPTRLPSVAAATSSAVKRTPGTLPRMVAEPDPESTGPGRGGAPAGTDRIRLVVIFGGRSAEHDVSCVTAASVLGAVDRTRYEVVPVGIDREGCWVRAEAA